MSKLLSKLRSFENPAPPVPEDPLPPATTSTPNQSQQSLKRRPSKMAESGPPERHVKSIWANNASADSHPPLDFYKPRTLWDTRDTFLPIAKPPPPLPKLEKHKRSTSQHHAKSPADVAKPNPIYRQPCATSSQSTSTGQSSYDLPVIDISRDPCTSVAPRARGALMRTNTRITASSGTSDESVSRWRLPSRWAAPSADADKDSKPGARLLSRFGSRKRAKSIPANNAHDALPEKRITLERL